jgi:hypothetical protein
MTISKLPKLLYRGVSQAMHEEGRGLRPRGTQSINVLKWGESKKKWGYGGKWGATEAKGVFKHQQAQKSFPTSAWISTTPDFNVAQTYALYSSNTGFVYVIDVSLLERHGVRMLRVAEAVESSNLGSAEDDEHALVAMPPGELPSGIVVNVIEVKR